MELKELAQRLGVNTYPEALENVYKNLDTSDDFTRAAGITEADVADWDCLK